MLERTGAKAALIITEGFRDIYEIGRINRPDAYNLFFTKHVPLVQRALRFEVSERLTPRARCCCPSTRRPWTRWRTPRRRGVEAVAVLFLHCYRNPAHEPRAKAILRSRCPALSSPFRTNSRRNTASSSAPRRLPRTPTSARASRVSCRYRRPHRACRVSAARSWLCNRPAVCSRCNQARAQCVRMLESGPASGVIAARAVCAGSGFASADAFDMGGTTAKAGVIYNGHVLTTGAALVGGYEQRCRSRFR